jgi:hypothetical protein
MTTSRPRALTKTQGDAMTRVTNLTARVLELERERDELAAQLATLKAALWCPSFDHRHYCPNCDGELPEGTAR